MVYMFQNMQPLWNGYMELINLFSRSFLMVRTLSNLLLTCFKSVKIHALDPTLPH